MNQTSSFNSIQNRPTKTHQSAKGLIVKLTPVQSAWESKVEKIRTMELAAYYNYLSKKLK